MDGIGSNAAFLEGEGASEYEGFWNGIRGKWVRFGTTPAREAQALGGRYTDVKRNVENVQWDDSQKRILFESEDLESISSGSDSQEVRPGWPPVDMGADSTRCSGSRLVNRSGRDSSC